ncbi:MAG TPA: GspE/PulE family protein, partial [Negativicutes bacterium]
MINLGDVTEDQIIEALARQLGVRLVDLSSMSISRETAAAIPLTLAERYTVIPIKKEAKKLTLAMFDPTNFFAIDDVQMVSGCEVEVVIAAKQEILRAINQSYGVQDLVEKAVNKLQPAETTISLELQTTEDAPVISIVNSLISQAIKERASDIHIEPQDNAVRVRFRVDGVLREVVTFPQHSHAAIISRVKIMSEMDIAEKRLPQDGRIKVQEDTRDIDIRVSTLPTILGEKVVLRILDKSRLIVDSKGLGFSDDNFQRVQKLYAQSQGMILVTGPTGSGKTTTLYTTLAELNSVEKNIITIEDPVEYRLKGINQIQVNQKAGLTFANGLRSLLRQDPNIVMVGEIRDKETADIAIRAALTGHLVLSTLHTNNAPGAIIRLLDMGIEPFLAASSILGIIAQRLVRVICTECKQSYSPKFDSPERVFLGIAAGAEVTLYRGAGCTHCEYTGYRGRIAIHEVMPTSSVLREAI